MFYRLKSSYVLRGWKGMAWVLVKRPENQIQVLRKEVFQILMLCDGETNINDISIDTQMENALKECEDDGIIESCEEASPLSSDQYYRYYNNRYVRKVFWSVTGRCNFRCRHCYMDAPDGTLGEISTEEALDLVDQFAECGVLRVDITGGEPLVRKDIWQIIDRICYYNITVGAFYTNGWLLNEEVLNEFEQRNLNPEISVSFDGVGWHDWMRGIAGAEQSALRALKICSERGFRTNVEMCIHRGNLSTLPKTIEVLHEVGVTNLKVVNVKKTELWNSFSEGNAMTLQEYMDALLPYIFWYYQSGRPIEHLELAGIVRLQQNGPGKPRIIQYDGTEKCLECYMCNAARLSCYITPEGRLLPCMPMIDCKEQDSFPKVQDIGLKQGLSDSYYMQFVTGKIKDLFRENPECAVCDYRYKCGGGCRAGALSHTHNLMGCDYDRCVFWKNGYDKRIQEAIVEAPDMP